ncbi:hypothetical protein [Streptomyces sp. NBC_00316]|uniref:hypothetical protein n=1 Tax=Streptomyces sp. NBC_00316 TaxID=2975710 RepID=UPI002E29CC90|nr:hypothetical protein [Streptomyces sp. NBC_00316]
MYITARGSVVGAVALATVLLAAVTGCSSGSNEGDSGSKLLGGLGTLAGDNSAKQVTFLDAARVRKLSKGDSKRFSFVTQPGSSLLNSYRPGPWGEHLKVTQIDTAVDTNEAGHWEGSFDAPAIIKSLKSHGYTRSERDGEEVWKHPGSTGVSFEVSEDEISYSSRDSDPMSAVTPKENSSLADNKEYRRAAECLGDVYRADFSPLSSPNPVPLAALGQQAASAAQNAEVLCFVVKDDATAQRLEAKLRSVVRTESPKFDGTKVTVEKGDQPVVRAVVPDTATQRPGRLIISDMELWMTAGDL